jgi:hypothetical protein
MDEAMKTIFINDQPRVPPEKTISGEYVYLLGELFYKIQNFDAMEPFFMSIVSSSDHWLYISSTGVCGRSGLNLFRITVSSRRTKTPGINR